MAWTSCPSSTTYRGPTNETRLVPHSHNLPFTQSLFLRHIPPSLYLLLLVQPMASWQSPLTGWHSRRLSESRIRSVHCYDCPTMQYGRGNRT